MAWQAKVLQALRVTKSFRSEYDHLMLQLHDGMKGDLEYQRTSPQETVPFPAGSVWVCFRTKPRMRSCPANTCWSRHRTCPRRMRMTGKRAPWRSSRD